MVYIYGRNPRNCQGCRQPMKPAPVQFEDWVCRYHFRIHLPGYECQICQSFARDASLNYVSNLMMTKGLLHERAYFPCTMTFARHALSLSVDELAPKLDLPGVMIRGYERRQNNSVRAKHFWHVERIVDELLWRNIFGASEAWA